MSRRTSERSRAVKLAWENEQNLVSKGRGTRDWTPEQQQQILDEGRALDDDRRAYEGHHMKNVNDYPEYAGDPGNIQFLTRTEHLKAHKGAWTNLTNWYYDPVSDIYNDFGLNKYEPCEVIELSDPIMKIWGEKSGECKDSDASKNGDRISENKCSDNTDKTTTEKKQKKPPLHKRIIGSIVEKGKPVVDAVTSFPVKHPKITAGLAAAFIVAKEYVKSNANSNHRSHISDDNSDSENYNDSFSDDSIDSDVDSYEENDSDDDFVNEEVEDRKGSPKRSHTRRGHMHPYWTGPRKGERKLIEKWVDDMIIHPEAQDNDESDD